MAEIRIRVGASLDGSPAAVFKSLGEMARKAKAQIEGDLAKAGEPLGKSVKSNAVKAERAIAELRAKLGGGDLMNPATRSIKTFGDDAAKRFEDTKRRFKELTREVEKGARDIETAEKRASKAATAAATKDARDSARSGRAFGRDAGRAGYGIARGALSLGSRLAGDIASGAGVEMDVSSMVRKNVGLQSGAVELANAGYMPGAAGAAGVRQDPGAILSDVRSVADATAYDPTEALEGLQAFVAKTGELATGRDILKDMAVLSKATGTALQDTVDAAGDVSNALGNIPNKQEAIQAVMRAVAGGGKTGAVEMKNFASQMAKVAASAPLFEGNVGENVVKLAALAQEARAHGGAASATQSATSVTSFLSQFNKGARLTQMKAFGVNTVGAGGKSRDFVEVMFDAIAAAGSKEHGGLGALGVNVGKMFGDVGSRRVTKGFEVAYAGAGGGEAGMAAMRAELEHMTSATLSAAEEQRAFTAVMETTQSKVQLFNNKLLDTVQEMQSAALPALQAIAPVALSLAGALAGAITTLLGGKKDKEGQDAYKAGAAAVNASGALDEVERKALYGVTKDEGGNYSPTTGTTVPEGLLEHGREAAGAVDKEIDAVRKRILEERKATAFDSPNPSADWAPMAFARQTALDTDTAALERLTEQSANLHASLDTLVAALLSGKVQEVKVVNLPTPPGPKLDGKGVPPVSDTPPLMSHE